jgi:hypothetical protein
MVKPLGTVSHALETVWNPIETQIEFHPATMQLNHTTRERLWDPWAYETVQWNYALRETSISYQSFTSWKPGRWNSPLRLALGRGSEPSRRTQQEEGASRHRDSDRCRSGATPPAAADRILPPPAVCPASRTGGLNAASIIPSGVPEPQPGPGRRRPARLNLRRHLPLESALLLPAAAILDFGPPHPRIWLRYGNCKS